MRALPPFDGLIAFDAALRHRSMTRAAAELGLTQSAISHRLKRLEAFVGAPLLNRTGVGSLPTPAGTTLAEGLGRMLDEMAELRARSRATVQPATLKIGLGSALANYWLVRRLPAFASAHPDVAIELLIIESDVQARALDLDVQIRWIPKASARDLHPTPAIR
jgi:LysR family glycine cleavage system transcriptional activator